MVCYIPREIRLVDQRRSKHTASEVCGRVGGCRTQLEAPKQKAVNLAALGGTRAVTRGMDWARPAEQSETTIRGYVTVFPRFAEISLVSHASHPWYLDGYMGFTDWRSSNHPARNDNDH